MIFMRRIKCNEFANYNHNIELLSIEIMTEQITNKVDHTVLFKNFLINRKFQQGF